MKVTGVSWTTFRLPLRAAFRTAGGEVTHREGVILRLVTDGGVIGLGEASPHPALSPAAAREVQEALERVAPRLLGAEVESLERLAPEAPPALVCAIDVAACDALARSRGVSVACLLSDQVSTSVPVNATIGAESDVEAATLAAAARGAGFSCVKLKMGMSRSIDEERRRVAAVRDALGPDVSLRIDANGSWGIEHAVCTIRALEEYGLELVEQPVAAGNLQGMARVRAAVDVPIAADEDVTGVEAARLVLEAGAAAVLVIKPMVVGGLRPARRIIELAVAGGAEALITTTLDAGVGTAAALHLAATLPPPVRACGLATGSLFAGDVVRRALVPESGRMSLPEGPGLAVELDEDRLARFAVEG